MNVTLSQTDRGDVEKTYHKSTFKQFCDKFKNFNWNTFISIINSQNRYNKHLNLKNPKIIIYDNPVFYSTIDSLLSDKNIPQWKCYLLFMLLFESAPYMSRDFESLYFNFYNKFLQGQAKPELRKLNLQN